MKWVALVLAVALAACLLWINTQVPAPPTVSTVYVRDSANKAAASQRAHVETLVVRLRATPADTMAAILRDRARRPAVLGADTVYLPTPDTTGDSACLSHEELVGVEMHRAVDSATIDSLRWSVKIWKTRGDSLEARLGAKLDPPWWKTSPVAFGAGYAAGIATCVVLK